MSNNNNSESFIKRLLDQNIRLDGREPFQRRNMSIEFMDKFGCLLYRQGKTEILIKTTTEITIPKPEKPSEGFILFKVNCMACSHSFDQNKKNANEIQKLLEKVIIESNSLDPESLCILTGKYVWQITVNCIVVRDCGNIIDGVLNGTIAALMDMQKPLVTVESSGVILGAKTLPLSIAHTPISFTYGLYENSIFLDPSLEEEKCSEARITVSMNVYNELCSIHKPGGKGITDNILTGILKVCEKQIKEVTNEIRENIKKRVSVRQYF